MDEDTQWDIRSVKDVKSKSVKRHTRGTAAKLVASGDYAYADDGPDDSKDVIHKEKINRIPQPTIELNPGGFKLDFQDLGKKKKQPRDERDMSKLSPTEKKQLRNTAKLSAPASTSPNKGTSALREAIDKSRAERTRS